LFQSRLLKLLIKTFFVKTLFGTEKRFLKSFNKIPKNATRVSHFQNFEKLFKNVFLCQITFLVKKLFLKTFL
jgi:hypothetical protein